MKMSESTERMVHYQPLWYRKILEVVEVPARLRQGSVGQGGLRCLETSPRINPAAKVAGRSLELEATILGGSSGTSGCCPCDEAVLAGGVRATAMTTTETPRHPIVDDLPSRRAPKTAA